MKTSYLNDWNADLLDEYYQRWKQDPASVDSSWSAFFEGFELGSSAGRNGKPVSCREGGRTTPNLTGCRIASTAWSIIIVFLAIPRPQIDPLAQARPETPALTLAALGLEDVPLDTVVSSRYFQQSRSMTLGEMIDTLRAIYCGPIGVEFMHIQNETVREWVRDRMEARIASPQPDAASQKRLLRCLMETETFEQFVHTKFIGQKRFSLQGGESLMVILETDPCRVSGSGSPGDCHGDGASGSTDGFGEFLAQIVQHHLQGILRELHSGPRRG